MLLTKYRECGHAGANATRSALVETMIHLAVCGVVVLNFIAANWRWLLGGLAVLSFILFGSLYSDSQKTQVHQRLTVGSQSTVADGLQRSRDDNMLSAMSAATAGSAAPPVPQFSDHASKLAYQRWMGDMSERLKAKKSDWQVREEFLQTVWYESHRAGLDVDLVLGLIQTTSDFNKFYVAQNGARGYMGVGTQWSTVLTDGDVGKLFHQQTNLRFGCVVLRYYLDERHGDLLLGLTDYYRGNLEGAAQVQTQTKFVNSVLTNRRNWVYVGYAKTK